MSFSQWQVLLATCSLLSMFASPVSSASSTADEDPATSALARINLCKTEAKNQAADAAGNGQMLGSEPAKPAKAPPGQPKQWIVRSTENAPIKEIGLPNTKSGEVALQRYYENGAKALIYLYANGVLKSVAFYPPPKSDEPMLELTWSHTDSDGKEVYLGTETLGGKTAISVKDLQIRGGDKGGEITGIRLK